MDSKLRIIVTGTMIQYPLGGVTWDYLQYVLGLARLGHDVFYIEDNDQWPYHPDEDGDLKSCTFNVEYIADVMARFGLEDRWAYRFGWKKAWYGMPDARRREVMRTADLLLNVSATTEKLDDYDSVKRLAYIDSDPTFTQVKLARGDRYVRELVDRHDVTFSFGECLPGRTPETGDTWIPTRQPVVIEEWETDAAPRDAWTTIMTWVSYKPLEFEGRSYGHKDAELSRFMDLPGRVAPIPLEIAANAGRGRSMPREQLLGEGWGLVDPRTACPDLDGYRRYVQSSRGEWSIAKNGYVEGQSGWFSCRSACFLAAGRPVVVQDTGFRGALPVGEGLLAFRTAEEAADGIRAVESDYARHAAAARAIAVEWFDARKVLSTLVEQAMEERGGEGAKP